MTWRVSPTFVHARLDAVELWIGVARSLVVSELGDIEDGQTVVHVSSQGRFTALAFSVSDDVDEFWNEF